MSASSIQFSLATHIMAALAFYIGDDISSSSLAESINAEPSFVRKSLSKLAKAGLVVTSRGKHGHCAIAREPDKITLRDIYDASNAPVSFAIHGYLAETVCPVSSNFRICMSGIQLEVQRSLEQALEKTTLAELLDKIRSRQAEQDAGNNG
jgi:DNA-binding IscR family transcriptional regulator